MTNLKSIDPLNVRESEADNSYLYTARQRIQLTFIHVIYTSDATVGNRQLVVEVKDDAGNVRVDFHAGAVQAASLVRHYVFQSGIYRETSFVNDEIQVAIPMGMTLEPNWTVTVRDADNVSVGDSMVVSIQGRK